MLVLEDIVVGSTEMFERFAQHEGYHHTVDLPRLISSAQEKVIKWLLAWEPKKGRLFSWFTKCSKNAFRSEVLKESQYRNRYHVTSDNLEKFFGSSDTEIDKEEAIQGIHKAVQEITSRWGCPQEVGAIRFLIECVLDEDNHDKKRAIRAASYAYCISPDLSKFFYDWVLINFRQQFYKQIRMPFTEQDLFRLNHSYSYLPDLMDIISWDQMKKIIACMGGIRLKIPTLAQMIKVSENHRLFEDIDASDLDPNSVDEAARKHRRSPRSAQEIYLEMCDNLNGLRDGEHDVY